LTQPSLTARNITAKALTITAASIASKAYDGTPATGSITLGSLSGFIGTETVTATATGAFADGNVEAGKAATITYTLVNGTNGGLAINYSLAAGSATGDITQATQTITFTTFTSPISAGTTIVATSNVNAPITYSSSNTSVATIDNSSGVVTVVANGNTTITASNAGNTNYTSATISQVLTVNPASTTLLSFDFAAIAGDEATSNSTGNSTGMATSTISRGAGLTSSPNAERFNATGWAVSNIANAVSGNDYMEFTITPNAGFQFSVTSILFQIQRSGTGLTAVALRSSIDNYSSNLDAEKSIV
jgi:hypothetical protein